MICSLFNSYPQSAQSRRHRGLWWAKPREQSSKYPKLKHETLQISEFLSIFRMSSRPLIKNFLATVLSLLFIHLLFIRSPILLK